MELNLRLMALFASDLDTGPAASHGDLAPGNGEGVGQDAETAGFAAIMAALVRMPDGPPNAFGAHWQAVPGAEAGQGAPVWPKLAALMETPLRQWSAGLPERLTGPPGVGLQWAAPVFTGETAGTGHPDGDASATANLGEALRGAQITTEGMPRHMTMADLAPGQAKPLAESVRPGALSAPSVDVGPANAQTMHFTAAAQEGSEKQVPQADRWFQAPSSTLPVKDAPKAVADGPSGRGGAAQAAPAEAHPGEQPANAKPDGRHRAMDPFIQRPHPERGDAQAPTDEPDLQVPRFPSGRENGLVRGALLHRGEAGAAEGTAPGPQSGGGGAGAGPAAAVTGDSLAPPDTRDAFPDVKTAAKADPGPEAPPVAREMQNDVLRQIVQRMTLHVEGRQSSMQIRLKPEFLGHLRLQVMTENQQVTIRMVAANAAVKQIIEQNAHVLKAELLQHGLQVHKLEVAVAQDNHDPWQNSQQTAQFRHSREQGRQEGRSSEGRGPDFEKTAGAEVAGAPEPATADGTGAVDYFA